MPPSKSQFRIRGRSYMDRLLGTTDKRQRFLIVCDGQTEPNYFRNFRVTTLDVKAVGTGKNTLGVVDEAIKLRDNDDDHYDQVWCVFDKDDFSIYQFESAITKANANDMKVAYSNQAFELWYLLHFEYINTAVDRKTYCDKLSKHLGSKYQKNSTDIYQKLLCYRDQAIKNAQRLLKEYNPSHPGRDDPSTRVHELVIALVENSKPFSGQH